MDLKDAIEQVIKNFPTIREDVKTNPKALFSLVGPIRKLIPTVDPKIIKSKLEDFLNSKVPEKEKKESIQYEQDVWQNKTTKEFVRRCILKSDEILTDKLRNNEFYENCFKTCYVINGIEFSENYIKVKLPMVYKKLFNKITNEEILKVKEKIDDYYLYVNPKKFELLKIQESEIYCKELD